MKDLNQEFLLEIQKLLKNNVMNILFIIIILFSSCSYAQNKIDSVVFIHKVDKNGSENFKWNIFYEIDIWEVNYINENLLNFKNDSANVSIKVIDLKKIENVPREYKRYLRRKKYSKFIVNAYLESVVFDLNNDVLAKEIHYYEKENLIRIFIYLSNNKHFMIDFKFTNTQYVLFCVYIGNQNQDFNTIKIIEIK